MENEWRERNKKKTKVEMEEKTCWRTYFGVLSRKGGVGFGRGRGEQCVPIVRRTHLLSLPVWSDEVMKWKRKEKKQGENS